MTQEQTNIIDQHEVLRNALANIDIAGKAYRVPEEITRLRRFGIPVRRSCRGRMLGRVLWSLATYYRKKDDDKVGTVLACQLALEEGMSFSLMPPFPARKALYNIRSLKTSQYKRAFEGLSVLGGCRN
jgi:hypothetical protein